MVPEIVQWDKNGKDAKGVDYSRLTALLIEAVKPQQALIPKQRAQLQLQQAKSKLQDAQITELQSQVKAIRASVKTNRRGSEVRTVKSTRADAAALIKDQLPN